MIGDAILSLPFIRAAQAQYAVFVCCDPSTADVFRLAMPDENIVCWRPPWRDLKGRYGLVRWRKTGFTMLIQRLRQIQPRTALSVWADPRLHLLMAVSRAGERYGYPARSVNFYACHLPWRRRQLPVAKAINLFGTICLRRRLLTRRLNRADYLQPHLEDWRQLAVELGLNWNTKPPWFSTPHVLLPAKLAEWLRVEHGLGKKVWLIHPGARNPNRRWPLEKFRTLIEQTFLPRKVPVIVIDLPESPIPRDWISGAFIYRPATLPEFIRTVDEVDCVLCNDTGISHVAAALGKRVISIFSAGLPAWFAPYGNEDLVVQNDVCPHRPCLDRCAMPSYVCLEALTSEMVKRQVEWLMHESLR